MTLRFLVVSPDHVSAPGGGSVVAERLRVSLGEESLHIRPGSSGQHMRLLGQSLLHGSFWLSYLPVSPSSWSRLRKLLAAFRPDVVHVHGYGHPATDAVTGLALHAQIPTVITVHGLPNLSSRSLLVRQATGGYLRIRRALLDRAAAVVCPTATVADSVRGLSRRSIEIIPWGIETQAAGSLREPRSAFPSLIAVGRVVRLKRLEIVIETLGRISQSWPNASLRIVGPVSDVAYHRELRDLLDRLGLNAVVSFEGSLAPDRCRAHLRASDLYVAASMQESFGLATLEAMAEGIPVVTTGVGAAAEEVASPGGYVLPTDSDSAVFAYACTVLLRDYGKAAPAARAKALQVSDRYSWDRTVEAYASVISRLTGKPIHASDDQGGEVDTQQ